jgi:hypothetical protein
MQHKAARRGGKRVFYWPSIVAATVVFFGMLLVNIAPKATERGSFRYAIGAPGWPIEYAHAFWAGSDESTVRRNYFSDVLQFRMELDPIPLMLDLGLCVGASAVAYTLMRYLFQLKKSSNTAFPEAAPGSPRPEAEQQ